VVTDELTVVRRPNIQWPFDDGDPFGLRPRFWTATADVLLVSSSLAALLAAGAPREIDYRAMAVFLRTGFFVGDDTPFAAICAVPPSPRIVWRRHGPDIESLYAPPPATTLTRAHAEHRFAELVEAAVGRAASAARGPLVVTLSGGHDSRHLLFALQASGYPPDCCVTVRPIPPSAPEEVAVARRVAALVDARHVVIEQRRDRLAAEREKNRLTHWCADEHAQFLPLRRYFAAGSHHVVDGLAGDVLSQSQRLDRELHRAFVERRFADVAERVLGDRATVEPAIQRLLAAEGAVRFSREAAVARVALEAARHAAAPNPIASFLFFSRTRREIALAPYAMLGVPVSTPFADPDVATFLLSLPYALVADRCFHTATIARRYPKYADIPYAAQKPGVDDRSAVRRAAVELATAVALAQSRFVHRGAVASRCVKAMATGSSADLWFLPRLVHLLDVEALGRDGPATRQRGSPSRSPAAA